MEKAADTRWRKEFRNNPLLVRQASPEISSMNAYKNLGERAYRNMLGMVPEGEAAGHGREHIRNVINNVKRFYTRGTKGGQLGPDHLTPEQLMNYRNSTVGAMLHDNTRLQEAKLTKNLPKGKKIPNYAQHARTGARSANDFLKEQTPLIKAVEEPYEFRSPLDRMLPEIVKGIQAHDTDFHLTPEGKLNDLSKYVMRDPVARDIYLADKWDGLGQNGVDRTISFAKEIGSTPDDLAEFLLGRPARPAVPATATAEAIPAQPAKEGNLFKYKRIMSDPSIPYEQRVAAAEEINRYAKGMDEYLKSQGHSGIFVDNYPGIPEQWAPVEPPKPPTPEELAMRAKKPAVIRTKPKYTKTTFSHESPVWQKLSPLKKEQIRVRQFMRNTGARSSYAAERAKEALSSPAAQKVWEKTRAAGEMFDKANPYLLGADFATGVLDPEGKVDNFKRSIQDMKTAPLWPGWNEPDGSVPTDPDAKNEYGFVPSSIMSPERRLREKERWTAYQADRASNWGSWKNWSEDIGNAWNSFHLGKGGAIANALFAAPSAAGAVLAEPIWENNRNVNNHPISEKDIYEETNKQNIARKKRGEAPIKYTGDYRPTKWMNDAQKNEYPISDNDMYEYAAKLNAERAKSGEKPVVYKGHYGPNSLAPSAKQPTLATPGSSTPSGTTTTDTGKPDAFKTPFTDEESMPKKSSLMSKAYFPTFRDGEAALLKVLRKKIAPGKAPRIIKKIANNPESVILAAAPGGSIATPLYLKSKNRITKKIRKILDKLGDKMDHGSAGGLAGALKGRV